MSAKKQVVYLSIETGIKSRQIFDAAICISARKNFGLDSLEILGKRM